MTPDEIDASRRRLYDERLATIDSQARLLHESVDASGNPNGLYTRVQLDRLDSLRAERRQILAEKRTR